MPSTIESLPAVGIALAVLGVVFIVAVLIISNFGSVVAPDFTTNAFANSTALNASGPAYTAASNKSHTVFFTAPDNYGQLANGTLTVDVKTNGTNYLNYYVYVNDYAVAVSDADGSFNVDRGYLNAGANTIKYTLPNSTNVTSSSMVFGYERASDVAGQNVYTRTLGGYSDLSGWIPVLIITIVGSLIMGLVLRSFGGKTSGR
jgi:hypothetical protein